MKNIETARLEIQKLVDQFDHNHTYYIKSDSDYNETQLRVDFINQFLNILGWDVYNEKKAPQNRREVVQEDIVEVDEGGEIFKRNPDYTIRFRGGYKSHGKQFIKDLPIRIIDFSNTIEATYYQEIVQLVQQLITNSEDQTKATTPQKQNVLAKHNRLLQQRINTIVERLYSIDHDDVKTFIDTLLPEKEGIRET